MSTMSEVWPPLREIIEKAYVIVPPRHGKRIVILDDNVRTRKALVDKEKGNEHDRATDFVQRP